MAVESVVQVTLPQMGESVTEGTVLEWHKEEGDHVDADEVLVEISTDKVDAEIPAPIAGTVVRQFAAEGDTVGGAGGAGGETIDIVTPAGGESVTEGTILEWSVKPGDEVQDGLTIVE